MKNLLIFFTIITISLTVNGQEQKVEIVPLVETSAECPKIHPPEQFICSVIGIPILMESFEFNSQHDIYNHLLKFPGVTISSDYLLNRVPIIRMRGDTNTIVIVDGIRYDTSILNTLNPLDIESIHVSNNPSAQNYFINN